MKNIVIVIIILLLASLVYFIFFGLSSGPDNKSNRNNLNQQSDDLGPMITLKTSLGDIKFITYPNQAPNTVANFIKLAKQDFYDNLIFHRVIDGFMIQTGDPTGTGTGGPGYTFADEINFNSELYRIGYQKGIVAMANAGPNTNGSQFFIMVANVSLPPAYTIFGRVIEGQTVADAISKLPRDANNRPLNPPVIQKVVIDKN